MKEKRQVVKERYVAQERQPRFEGWFSKKSILAIRGVALVRYEVVLNI